ncbi:hypothetical protein MNV84_00370 [Leishmania braziliensis]|nr:hypothetical protein MNV84_00370 [Leishmania braziliensis]
MATAAAAGTSQSGPHARFIAETTQLLWGGDYPSWIVQQWVRWGDVGDDEEDEGDDDDAVVAAESGVCSSTSGNRAQTADDATLGREGQEGGKHIERIEGTASAAVSDSDAPVPATSPSWTLVMQQAFEALQLHLPLQHSHPPPQPQLASTDEAPVMTLAKHLVQDAPLLWLRYLLVPMYTQWTQQRAVAPPDAGATTPTATAPIPSSLSPLKSVATALERDGAVTMHKLLGALGTASMSEALRKEQSWSDDLVELVTAAVAAPPSAAAATLKVLHRRRTAIQDQQRQHTGEMLYFTGTLAKAAQSFMVLGQGGCAILTALIMRLLGRAKAAWVEWASRLSEADVQGAAQAMYCSDAHETRADCDSTGDVKTVDDAAGKEAPAKKPVQVEPSLQRAASFSDDPRTTPAESFAALRAAVNSTAQRQAQLVWRCWYILYGYYGADLYTNEALARALEEDDLEKAGVRRMAVAQQAHWRRLRLAADVKQHALSETHWLWCSTLLASVETTLTAALSEKCADGHVPVRTCTRASTTNATDAPPVYTTELLYRRLLESTVRVFAAELRNTLRVYGEAALALRSGGLHNATATVPSALQAVAHNVVALQDVFAQCLLESFRQAPTAAMSPHQMGSALRTRAGAYLWQLYPTLLRVQVPEEVSWMCTTGAEQGGDGVGASHTAEVAAGQFAEQFQRHWRRRGRQLSAVMSDAFYCTEQMLTHERCYATSPSLLPSPSSNAAPLTAAASVSKLGGGNGSSGDGVSGRNEADDGTMVARLLAAIVHRPAEEVATSISDTSSSSSSANNDAWTAALCDVAADFYALYDQSCFFALRPERQRLFTLSVQRLYRLLLSPLDGSSDGSSPSQGDASGSATKTTLPLCQQPLVCILRRDTRLWMLLTHGTLLQLERRGRMAREDETLLASYLLPLLVLLGSRHHDGEFERGSADSSLSSTAAGAPPVWADTTVAEDVLLLLASGLASLPWDLEELYVTVQRHTALYLRHSTRRQGRLSADRAAAVTVMAAWFGTAELAALSAAPSSPTTAVASPWDFSGVSEVGSPTARSDTGPAALARETAQLDAQCRRDDPLLPHREEEAASTSAVAGTHDPKLTAPPRLSEATVDARFAEALARHGRLTSVSLSSAPCGLLMVVGAYRSCGRALHSLRTALEEQHRMAREDEVGEFVGRSVTFCTSEDIAAFRGLVMTVHSCVFGYACQPRGLLRLWLGYLQHLFGCVVPRSVLPLSGDATRNKGDDALVLMPNSWQRRHLTTSLFGAQVYCTGWRALQHDGEPASQTRLREVLGECLANLMLLPYSHSLGNANCGDNEPKPPTAAAEKDAAAATQAILQRTLPHAVLEILCELLYIPVEDSRDSASNGKNDAAVDAAGTAIKDSFLGLAGLLAFLRRLELLVVPGSLQDPRLVSLLHHVYEAANTSALGI